MAKLWGITKEQKLSTPIIQYRHQLSPSEAQENFMDNFKQPISFIENDRILHDDIQQTIAFLKPEELE